MQSPFQLASVPPALFFALTPPSSFSHATATALDSSSCPCSLHVPFHDNPLTNHSTPLEADAQPLLRQGRQALDVTCLSSIPGDNPMSLISVDIDRITSVIDPLHQMWSSLITITIGLYLIYKELGVAFVATIIVTIVIMVVTPYFSGEI
ncbi:hypothetical protein C8R42DRAFT_294443 [Lentinula raphanica]|nr:hypothetical protein C8R42DRAFT_294443 [Lentinula raphanica]